MRQVTRYLFTVFAGLSLLLCVGVCVLWVRSIGSSDAFRIGTPYRYVIFSTNGTLTLHPQAPPFHDGIRFAYGHRGAFGFGTYVVDHGRGDWRRAYELPHWFCVAASLALPLRWLMGRATRKRSESPRTSGVCATCGYDMRATPDRCPECGAAVSSAAS